LSNGAGGASLRNKSCFGAPLKRKSISFWLAVYGLLINCEELLNQPPLQAEELHLLKSSRSMMYEESQQSPEGNSGGNFFCLYTGFHPAGILATSFGGFK
jgi:hypothetical protein